MRYSAYFAEDLPDIPLGHLIAKRLERLFCERLKGAGPTFSPAGKLGHDAHTDEHSLDSQAHHRHH